MEAVTRDDLQRLLQPQRPPCLSLYLPTHRRPPDTEMDPVRYRNLLDRIRARYQQQFNPTAKALREFFAPLEALTAPDFWVGQLDGLAVFRSQDTVAAYRLPAPVEEAAIIGERFHVRPLLPVVSGQGLYYVLALSQGDVTLYEGNRFGLTALDLADLPANLKDAVGTEDVNDPLSFRWHQKGRNPMFAGHGTGANDNDDDVIRYFREVDRIVSGRLKGRDAPLVLAAPAQEWQLYRAANSYPGLLDTALDGNHDRDTPELLHQRTWPMVAPLFDERLRTLREQYRSLAMTGRATHKLQRIARAAVEGRVLALLIAEGQHVWGRLDRQTGQLEVREAPGADAVAGMGDALDDLACETLNRGGEVYVVPADQMPCDGPVGAIFRY